MKPFLLIQQEISDWSKRQPWHPHKHAPHLGIAEEIGELTHVILKEFQGIRKMDYAEKMKDAVADTMIYLLHWCSLHQKGLSPVNFDKLDTIPERIILGFLHCSAGQLIIATEHFHDHDIQQSIFNYLLVFCKNRKWNLLEITNRIWDDVSKRDWTKFPKDGLTQ